MGLTFNLSISKELLADYTALVEYSAKTNMSQSEAFIKLARAGLQAIEAKQKGPPPPVPSSGKNTGQGLNRVADLAHEFHDLTDHEFTVEKAFHQKLVSKEDVRKFFNDCVVQVFAIVGYGELYTALGGDLESRENVARLKRMILSF